jgi:hypothetical protein
VLAAVEVLQVLLVKTDLFQAALVVVEMAEPMAVVVALVEIIQHPSKVAVAEAALFALSIPVILAPSRQQIQGTCNGTIYSH